MSFTMWEDPWGTNNPLDKTMHLSLEKGVEFPHHKEPLVLINRQMRKCRQRETGDPFLKIFVPRADWKAAPETKAPQPMETPVSCIRFWKYTNTDACKKKEQCFWILQEIQERHISVGFGDIRFNFLIGGDGSVYEGRGWDKRPPEDPTYEHDKENHLEIGFIGDIRIKSKIYNAYRMQLQFESALHLIEYGQRNNLIINDYKPTWKEK